jgi:hypothetical protein
MKFWEGQISYNARKVLVIPNITNSSNIEKDSFVDVIYNHIKGLELYGEYFWHIILPQPVKKLNLINVKQHILPYTGDMIKMRTYPPDIGKLMETLDYDVIYSHLPDWPQVGRYRKDEKTKIIGYCHWWEMKSCNAEDRKNRWRWLPIELLGVSQMDTCYLNTQDQKNRVLEEAKELFNNEFVAKLDSTLRIWHLAMPQERILRDAIKEKYNIIVFNHRAAAYKGYPKFIEMMKEYRERRQDFTVWVPQLDEPSPESWIDSTKLPKEEYYKKLQQCKVGVQMRQSNYGWSVSATDCMMNGTAMVFQEADCYREIHKGGLFFKRKSELFEHLDKLLDDENYRRIKERVGLNMCGYLLRAEQMMFEELHKKLSG